MRYGCIQAIQFNMHYLLKVSGTCFRRTTSHRNPNHTWPVQVYGSYMWPFRDMHDPQLCQALACSDF